MQAQGSMNHCEVHPAYNSAFWELAGMQTVLSLLAVVFPGNPPSLIVADWIKSKDLTSGGPIWLFLQGPKAGKTKGLGRQVAG